MHKYNHMVSVAFTFESDHDELCEADLPRIIAAMAKRLANIEVGHGQMEAFNIEDTYENE